MRILKESYSNLGYQIKHAAFLSVLDLLNFQGCLHHEALTTQIGGFLGKIGVTDA